jgi:hypothetical protein
MPFASHLDIKHPLGNDPAIPGSADACVLDSVLKVEQHPWFGSVVALINQHRPSA